MSSKNLEPELADTRERILLQASRVFASKGYQQAKLDEIAREAGLTKGAIYWHFRNKSDLFCALLESRMQRNTAPLSTELSEALQLKDDNSRRLALTHVLKATLARFRSDADWPRLCIEFVAQSRDADVAERVRGLNANGRRIAIDVVEAMKVAGLTDKHINTDMLSLFWYALIDGLMMAWIVRPEVFADDAVIDEMVEMLWRGLAPK
ncbi:MAG: TetR family transcriptional regulator [Moraxellaceae bacterium]|nr:TetR family transcriptional regulator [Moraxellaceae bacterium]MDZ4297436.1 TetR family transcriptional regulator [Moraxellaceae bacterium]MDZ4387417.1 TetR family transcriptional regulator [Moraxellaceae bacterium]